MCLFLSLKKNCNILANFHVALLFKFLKAQKAFDQQLYKITQLKQEINL